MTINFAIKTWGWVVNGENISKVKFWEEATTVSTSTFLITHYEIRLLDCWNFGYRQYS